MRLIEKVWFERHPAQWLLVPLLLPLSGLFYVVSLIRRLSYRLGLLDVATSNIPIVVVGNIGVGGNGKTPLTVYLIEQLSMRGIKVGVVSRGYGGKAPYYPYLVTHESRAEEVGDEPLLIFNRCRIDVAVGADRIASVNLLAKRGCQLVVADDGLQHYRLPRDLEIIVVDAKRQFGNGLLLPAGPLRETTARLATVDFIVSNGAGQLVQAPVPAKRMTLIAKQVVNLSSGERLSMASFIANQRRVNAIAGIGDPQRFFDTLLSLGFTLVQQQGFIDHQQYTLEPLQHFCETMPLLMTEKDAVKCQAFAKSHWWYVPVEAEFEQQDSEDMVERIAMLIK